MSEQQTTVFNALVNAGKRGVSAATFYLTKNVPSASFRRTVRELRTQFGYTINNDNGIYTLTVAY